MIEGDLTNRRFRNQTSGEVYQVGKFAKRWPSRDRWHCFNENTLQSGTISRKDLQSNFEEVINND